MRQNGLKVHQAGCDKISAWMAARDYNDSVREEHWTQHCTRSFVVDVACADARFLSCANFASHQVQPLTKILSKG